MSKILSPYVLVILMTVTSGCADAISFIALGQVLTAAMTGNTVFLGLALVNAGGLQPMGYVFALGGFMLGAAAGATLLRKNRDVKGTTPAVTRTLLVEASAMFVFGMLSIFAPVSNYLVHSLLIISLSFAMGCQGTAARRINVNSVPTTVITSMTTGLMESLVWNMYEHRQTRNNPIVGQPVMVSKSLMFVWVIDLVAYGVGAAACGLVALHWHFHAIWLPFAIVLVIMFSTITRRTALKTHETTGLRA